MCPQRRQGSGHDRQSARLTLLWPFLRARSLQHWTFGGGAVAKPVVPPSSASMAPPGGASSPASLLGPAMAGTDAVIAHVQAFATALRIACLATGSADLAGLRRAPLL